MSAIPEQFLVSVVLESRPSKSMWQDVCWSAVGVCGAGDTSETDVGSQEASIVNCGETEQYIYSPLKLRLFRDECESYYHNLMSPEPGCFIVARENDNGRPIPFLVSMSFDEVHAYQEGDDLVYAVPIPPELYRWMEAYVIENYAPIKRKKRKRKNWKTGE